MVRDRDRECKTGGSRGDLRRLDVLSVNVLSAHCALRAHYCAVQPAVVAAASATALMGILAGLLFIEVNAKAMLFVGVQVAASDFGSARKDLANPIGKEVLFLNAEVVRHQVQV